MRFLILDPTATCPHALLPNGRLNAGSVMITADSPEHAVELVTGLKRDAFRLDQHGGERPDDQKRHGVWHAGGTDSTGWHALVVADTAFD